MRDLFDFEILDFCEYDPRYRIYKMYYWLKKESNWYHF